jgi:hypothetical protein
MHISCPNSLDRPLAQTGVGQRAPNLRCHFVGVCYSQTQAGRKIYILHERCVGNLQNVILEIYPGKEFEISNFKHSYILLIEYFKVYHARFLLLNTVLTLYSTSILHCYITHTINRAITQPCRKG